MIGIIDSGVGGLSVWKEIRSHPEMPGITYVADTPHMPYGKLGSREIRQRVTSLSNILINRQCKIVILACNTATVRAIASLRSQFSDTIFIGMEPAIKPAALLSKNGRVGLIATRSTINSQRVCNLIKQFGKNCSFFFQVDQGLAESIEHNEDIGTAIVNKHIIFAQQKNIDTLILGCSHYPLVISKIRELLPSKINILHTGLSILERLQKTLQELTRKDDCQKQDIFLTTGSAAECTKKFSRLLKQDIRVTHVDEDELAS